MAILVFDRAIFMHQFDYDIVFVGGGLVNGLLAWQLKRARPGLRFLILEKGNSFGENHTWSFHEQDVSASALKWLTPLLSASWPSYQVAFPEHERQIESRYFSIRSKKFHEVLFQDLADDVRFGVEVVSIEGNRVLTQGGVVFQANSIFDGRGKTELDLAACGFQKFFGLEIETAHPHGLTAPILMDATVEQLDGYRFLYCLPWSENRLLVEDTRYSNSPELNPVLLRQEVLKYCLRRNWQVKEVFYEEEGCLPLPLKKEFVRGGLTAEKSKETALTVGMRAGLFHPTTGYSFPMAVKTVEVLLESGREEEWPELLARFCRKTYRQQTFFMLLNRVLFLANPPERRFRFLQHFYRLPSDLINAFYSHRLSAWGKIRFFLRRPPVSLWDAFRAVRNKALYET